MGGGVKMAGHAAKDRALADFERRVVPGRQVERQA